MPPMTQPTITPDTPVPQTPTRLLRLAMVDEVEALRFGWNYGISKIPGTEVVLMVAMGSELLQALRAGLLVDVVFVRLHARHTAADALVKALADQFPAVRTMIGLEEREEALAERAKAVGGTWIVPLADINQERLVSLVAEMRAVI
ncbi:MAG: hypothetical protein ABI599_11260 [Flavobacteriales bacterium]